MRIEEYKRVENVKHLVENVDVFRLLEMSYELLSYCITTISQFKSNLIAYSVNKLSWILRVSRVLLLLSSLHLATKEPDIEKTRSRNTFTSEICNRFNV